MTSYKKASSFELVRNDAAYLFQKSLTMPAALQTWMARIGYPMYQNAQKQRWITQNASEGETWKEVSKPYQAWKDHALEVSPEKYPGGRRVMVLTGKLADSVTGKNLDFHRVVFTDRGFQVATALPYAKYANDARNFTDFSPATREKISGSLRAFVLKHISKGGS